MKRRARLPRCGLLPSGVHGAKNLTPTRRGDIDVAQNEKYRGLKSARLGSRERVLSSFTPLLLATPSFSI